MNPASLALALALAPVNKDEPAELPMNKNEPAELASKPKRERQEQTKEGHASAPRELFVKPKREG